MQRERLTITIEPDLIKAVDETINKQSIRNRSHAIETLIKKGLSIGSLNQAFIFLRNGWTPERLSHLLLELKQIEIKKIYFCNQTKESLNPDTFKTEIEIEEVSNTFGSGGALLLKKEDLTNQFITIFLSDAPTPSQNLLAAHSFHLINKPLCTHLIATQNTVELKWSGFDIIEPEAINYINMGVSEIDETLLPTLLKENKLKTYA